MKDKELIEILLSFKDSDEIGDGDHYDKTQYRLAYGDINKKELKDLVGEFEYVLTSEISSLGDHDSIETVIYFKDHDIYLSIDGYYNSQEGCNFDEGEWTSVKPKTKTITYYE